MRVEPGGGGEDIWKVSRLGGWEVELLARTLLLCFEFGYPFVPFAWFRYAYLVCFLMV